MQAIQSELEQFTEDLLRQFDHTDLDTPQNVERIEKAAHTRLMQIKREREQAIARRTMPDLLIQLRGVPNCIDHEAHWKTFQPILKRMIANRRQSDGIADRTFQPSEAVGTQATRQPPQTAATGNREPTNRQPLVRAYLDWPAKQRKLLVELDGKVNVPIDDVLTGVYDSADRGKMEALLKLVKDTNKKLATNEHGREIKKQGDTLVLKQI